jgi:hypothetical protein
MKTERRTDDAREVPLGGGGLIIILDACLFPWKAWATSRKGVQTDIVVPVPHLE